MSLGSPEHAQATVHSSWRERPAAGQTSHPITATTSMHYQRTPGPGSYSGQLSYPAGPTSSPIANPEQRGEGLFTRQAHAQQPHGSQPVSPGSTTPLSDILEKTHAQIASQHRRNDSAVGRASPSGPALPFHPQPNQFYPSLSDQMATAHHHHHSPSYAGVSPLHQQHPAHMNYAQSPTGFHEHAHSIPSSHMSTSLPTSAGNVHVSSVAARKRRGNLPREAVRLFKKWVEENKRYPYPNEAQKQDFERMTGLSMQQINNWFINARRRNLSERERAEMKREKERQSQSGSPASSRPDSSHGLSEPDAFSLDALSRHPSHSREQSHGGSQGTGYQ